MEIELKQYQVISCCSALAAAAEEVQPGFWDETGPGRMEALRARLQQLGPHEVRPLGPTGVAEEETVEYSDEDVEDVELQEPEKNNDNNDVEPEDVEYVEPTEPEEVDDDVDVVPEDVESVESEDPEKMDAQELVELPVWDISSRCQIGSSKLKLVQLPMEEGDKEPLFHLLQGERLREYDSEQVRLQQLQATRHPVQLQATCKAPPPRPPPPLLLPAPINQRGTTSASSRASCWNPYLIARPSMAVSLPKPRTTAARLPPPTRSVMRPSPVETGEAVTLTPRPSQSTGGPCNSLSQHRRRRGSAQPASEPTKKRKLGK